MPPLSFASTYKIPHPHAKSLDALRDRLEYVEHETREYRGTIRPCGKGSIGFAPRKKLSKADEDYERNSFDVRGVYYSDVDSVTGEYQASSTYVQQHGIDIDSCLPCQEYQSVATEKRKASVLTGRGKKYIEDACFLLERKHTPQRLGFYTLTLSITDREHIELFNSRAATILKRYFEKMKRYYERANEQFFYIGVWEYHPSRSINCGIPVLHFHYVAPCYRTSTQRFVASPGKIRRAWTESVRNGIKVQSIRACRIGCEVVKRSASGYLGKYMSKGVPGGEADGFSGGGVCLSSWYSISRNLLRVVHKCRTPVGLFIGDNPDTDSIRQFIDDYTAVSGLITKVINGREVLLGYWFELEPYFHGCLLVRIDIILSSDL